MMNGVTNEFGQVFFDGATVPADRMVGAPGDGWAVAMTVVGHEREPSTLGYAARYGKLVRELLARNDGPVSEELAWAAVQSEMLTHHVRRRLSEQLDGVSHGPEGSLDKLLMTWVEQSVGHAALAVAGPAIPICSAPTCTAARRASWAGHHRYRRTSSLRESWDWESDVYDMPAEIDVRADGALRIITLNRPDSLNSVNDDLHSGLARIWQRLTDDPTARAAVITGAGRAFSAGGDFGYLEELADDADLRAKTIRDGREIVLGMARCRIPVVAAVNGPAVGLGCSLVALSDIVYIAEDAYLADPHVQVGLVAADGGPLTWPLHISLLLAKEYALTGTRIRAERAVELGLGQPRGGRPGRRGDRLREKDLELPQQAVESTKRVLNIHLERAVLASLDYALSAENQSFLTEDFRSIVTKLAAGKN